MPRPRTQASYPGLVPRLRIQGIVSLLSPSILCVHTQEFNTDTRLPYSSITHYFIMQFCAVTIQWQ